jgi:hypothetical protein
MMPFINIVLIQNEEYFKPFIVYALLSFISATAAWLMPFDTADKNLDNF